MLLFGVSVWAYSEVVGLLPALPTAVSPTSPPSKPSLSQSRQSRFAMFSHAAAVLLRKVCTPFGFVFALQVGIRFFVFLQPEFCVFFCSMKCFACALNPAVVGGAACLTMSARVCLLFCVPSLPCPRIDLFLYLRYSSVPCPRRCLSCLFPRCLSAVRRGGTPCPSRGALPPL